MPASTFWILSGVSVRPASPKHAPAALSDEPLEPPCPRDEKLDALDKFDALDAELNEQLLGPVWVAVKLGT